MVIGGNLNVLPKEARKLCIHPLSRRPRYAIERARCRSRSPSGRVKSRPDSILRTCERSPAVSGAGRRVAIAAETRLSDQRSQSLHPEADGRRVEDRVMSGTDQLQWPGPMAYSINVIQNADDLTLQQKRDILYNAAVRFMRFDIAPTQKYEQSTFAESSLVSA